MVDCPPSHSDISPEKLTVPSEPQKPDYPPPQNGRGRCTGQSGVLASIRVMGSMREQTPRRTLHPDVDHLEMYSTPYSYNGEKGRDESQSAIVNQPTNDEDRHLGSISYKSFEYYSNPEGNYESSFDSSFDGSSLFVSGVEDGAKASERSEDGGTGKGPYEWDIGMFDCFYDAKNCLCVTLCCPCYVVYLSQFLDVGLMVPCIGGLLFPPTCCIPIAIFRNRIRNRLDIKGSLMSDILSALYCGACVLCQIKNQYHYSYDENENENNLSQKK